jgi:hypothetical protein
MYLTRAANPPKRVIAMSDYGSLMNCPRCGGRVTDPDREGCPVCRPEEVADD